MTRISHATWKAKCSNTEQFITNLFPDSTGGQTHKMEAVTCPPETARNILIRHLKGLCKLCFYAKTQLQEIKYLKGNLTT